MAVVRKKLHPACDPACPPRRLNPEPESRIKLQLFEGWNEKGIVAVPYPLNILSQGRCPE